MLILTTRLPSGIRLQFHPYHAAEACQGYQKIRTGGHTQIRLSHPKAGPVLGMENDPDSGVRKPETWDKRGRPNEIVERKVEPILGSENDPDSGVRKRHQVRGRFMFE